MEILTFPQRPAATPWARLLVSVAILTPVTVLVLLPIGLGLDRYVMSTGSMEGSIGRGSLLLERDVPVSDLRLGDVITFRPPPSSGVDHMVTHRIVRLDARGIRTKGDAEPAVDPWVLRPDGPTVSRVVFTVPWIGYAHLVLARATAWPLTVGSALLLGVLLVGAVHRRRTAPASAEKEGLQHPAVGAEP